MRTWIVSFAMVLVAACGVPAMDVPLEPPERPVEQTSDLPPRDFLAADLLIIRRGDYRPYCFGLDELLEWLDKEGMRDQRWTRLDALRWRLDGYTLRGEEHTVWVFDRVDGGVVLAGYRDSDIDDRTADDIMRIYYPHLNRKYVNAIRSQYGTCENPYD